MRLLLTHYQRLFNAQGSKYADRITSAYSAPMDYLAFLDKLHGAEKAVAAAAIATVGAQADRELMARIKTCAHELRLKDAQRFYHEMA